jgi:hypothetical protein
LTYSDCVTPSPKSCETVDEIEPDQKICVEGCACPEGLIFAKTPADQSSNEPDYALDLRIVNKKPKITDLKQEPVCVKREDCPCSHHGKLFQSGSTVQWDCNTW